MNTKKKTIPHSLIPFQNRFKSVRLVFILGSDSLAFPSCLILTYMIYKWLKWMAGVLDRLSFSVTSIHRGLWLWRLLYEWKMYSPGLWVRDLMLFRVVKQLCLSLCVALISLNQRNNHIFLLTSISRVIKKLSKRIYAHDTVHITIPWIN